MERDRSNLGIVFAKSGIKCQGTMMKANGSAGRQRAHRNDVGATGGDGNQCPKCNQYNSGISKKAHHLWFDLPDPDPWQLDPKIHGSVKSKSSDLFHG